MYRIYSETLCRYKCAHERQFFFIKKDKKTSKFIYIIIFVYNMDGDL